MFLFLVENIVLKISISEIILMINQILGADFKHGLGLKPGLLRTFCQQRCEKVRSLVWQQMPLMLLVVYLQISILISVARFMCK